MNISTITRGVTLGLGRTALVGRKYSPQILTAVGIASGVAATFFAAKATLKLEPIIDDHLQDVELIKFDHNENQHKDLAYRYAKTAVQLTKLYGPALSIGSFGVICIVSAQGIMQRRNAALTAAYVALEKGFQEYRKRVIEQIGEEKEGEIYHTAKIEQDEQGVAKIVNGVSPYARLFDEFNPNWTKNVEWNLLFLQMQQNYFNDRLHSKGHVFLNEVYDALGMERSQAGQMVGWVLGRGDDYIDFGVFEKRNEMVLKLPTSRAENFIVLDFNVAGVVYDQIGPKF